MHAPDSSRSLDGLPRIRDHLLGKTAYGAPQIDVPVRLNTNENPHPPSAELVAAIQSAVGEAARTAHRYPESQAVQLRSALADYVAGTTGIELDRSQVWAANGSNEVLQQLMLAYAGPGRVVMGFEPSYSMHRLIAESTGARYVPVPRDAEFRIDVDRAVEAVRTFRPSVVFVCSPNNPTGGSSSAEAVLAIHDASDALIVLDEAYVEFSHAPSLVPLLPGRPRIAVSRTMSKAFGLAGVRVGFVVADARVIDAVQLVRLPYHLSGLTQAAALVALEHRAELLANVEALKVQRDRIVSVLTARGLGVAESDANFVLFQVPGRPATALWQSLLDRGVLVRDVGIDGYLRVTAGTEEETGRFLAALADATS